MTPTTRRAGVALVVMAAALSTGCGQSGVDIPGVVDTNGSTGRPAGSAAATTPASAGPGEIGIANLEATIAQQYQAGGGAAATVSCPQAAIIAATPGQTFQCTFRAADGRSGTLTVTVTSAGGAYTWAIP